jgi:hypothetical protein
LKVNVALASDTDYLSENILEIIKPFSLIEWYCNITEYSYTNHDNHPHLHKCGESLDIIFSIKILIKILYTRKIKKSLFL